MGDGLLYICNAFSLSMLPDFRLRGYTDKGEEGSIDCETGLTVTSIHDPVGLLKMLDAEGLRVVSAVGHADTAALFSELLGMEVAVNRVSIELTDADEMLVGQYVGPRMPEGTKELPEGARINWLHVMIDY